MCVGIFSSSPLFISLIYVRFPSNFHRTCFFSYFCRPRYMGVQNCINIKDKRSHNNFWQNCKFSFFKKMLGKMLFPVSPHNSFNTYLFLYGTPLWKVFCPSFATIRSVKINANNTYSYMFKMEVLHKIDIRTKVRHQFPFQICRLWNILKNSN